MEEYSNKDDAHGLQDQGDGDLSLSSNVTSDVNDCSEILNTDIPINVNEKDVSLDIENKTSETHSDTNIEQQLEGAPFSTGDNLKSNIEEIGQSESITQKEAAVDVPVGLSSIESELEKIHQGIDTSVTEKIESFVGSDDKMDWTENIDEASSANVEATKESLETEDVTPLQQVLEGKDESPPVKDVDKPVESPCEEKMDVSESEVPEPSKEPELAGSELEKSTEAETEPKDSTRLEEKRSEDLPENIDEGSIAVSPNEQSETEKAATIESEVVSVDNQSVSTESQSTSMETQSIPENVPPESQPLSAPTESQSISSSTEPVSTENQSVSSETQSMSVESTTPLETQPTPVESGTSVSESEPISTTTPLLASESQSSSAETQSVSTESQSVSAETQVIPLESHVESSTENNSVESSSSVPKERTIKISKSVSASSSEQEKEKTSDNQRENTEFVQVNTENEKDGEYNEKDDESNNRALMEHDPIGSDSFEPMNNEDREGADAELCIIPDTEREISQAEKDAASIIPPLRDLTAASASTQSENNLETMSSDQSGGGSPIIIFRYEKEDLQICNECKLQRKVKYYYTANNTTKYLCDENCLNILKRSQEDKVAFNWEEGSLRVKNFSGTIKEPPSLSFIRKCASCKKVTNDIENNLTWEIMDFCNEFCLSKYQKEIGSHCSSCQGEVKSNSLGKYCVRFGNDIRQFCTSTCLEKYKKGLKVCSYCQQDMSGGPEGFLAPVGDKGQFKDFCSQLCMEKYDIMTNDRPPKVAPGTICSVCKAVKQITIEFELDGIPNYFCSEPCFVAFSFVNNISPGKCAMCRRHFTKATLEQHTMYYDNVQHSFCSNSCENIYIIAHRKIVPCSWCKVKKYNFDMIRRYSKTGPMINMCSLNCLSLYRVSINAVNSRKTVCNFCLKLMHPMYHLTMSDATLRNFCSYNCVMGFQNQFPKQPITLNTLGESGFPVPTGAPKKNKKHPGGVEPVPPSDVTPLPIISSVQSLASTNGNISPGGVPPSLTPITTRSTRSKSTANTGPQVLNSAPQIINSFADLPVQVQIKQHFIVRPAPIPDQRNVGTMCYTRKANKGTTIKPIMVDEGIQTEEREASKILIPVPVPIYVPTPMQMFSVPTPVPVPFPVPVPVPIFIPTTRNSAAGIMKEIKKIQLKIPTDPYEAELLMMAEMVAEEKKEEVTDSESDVDDTGGPEDSYSPEPVDASNTFGDDMLQMALKMATELDEPAVDLEGALTANTITAPQGSETHAQEENVDDPQPIHPHLMERSPSVRGRKRGMRQPRGGAAKRGRRMSHQQVELPLMHQPPAPPLLCSSPPEPAEKPDANMCLKYTFGVNAWKQWVTTKNAELEKSSIPNMLFKTEILQLTSDELNYSLCLFVKEVRKPNGAEYAPDTIYYLCLGIQQYLFENGRIDNIFCDAFYEKFTDCLDEVAKKFSVLYNDSHYIVTRVEEEHLWESKQLGAHSPHVLLSTLMFFNTKHFNLTTVDEHMQLSFSHIMKHWKRNPNQPVASKMPGLRNVLLRFYPPQSAIQNNTRKKKVYEQEQNEENPLRCPVKLYEFYLSKCPESVKTRNDVFYLQPERSCVPDSPVWYSTMPLPREALEKMLHRVKMVKEINVALLTS